MVALQVWPVRGLTARRWRPRATALDCGRRSFDQLSMSKSFCSSVSLTAEYTLPPKVTAMVRSTYSSKTIGFERSLRHA
ncbi:hypothetical protein [Streptomyces blattellae]|uniref:hypothetical protein n=1 Tax=Streptomyces blattellae TaxID=2569855 RepID=UPI001E55E3C3|nr:hypothetical protein [Streptomyces blattellae]